MTARSSFIFQELMLNSKHKKFQQNKDVTLIHLFTVKSHTENTKKYFKKSREVKEKNQYLGFSDL